MAETKETRLAEGKGSRSIGSFIYKISTICNWVGAFFIFCMMLLTTIDVIMRGAVNRPITGAIEGTQLMLLIAVAFGLSYTQYKKGHISVELLVSRFSRRAKSINGFFVHLICLGIYALIAWQAIVGGWRQQAADVVVSEVIKIPIHPFYYILAFGCIILCLVYILDLIADVYSPGRGSGR